MKTTITTAFLAALLAAGAAHAFPFLDSWHNPSDANPRAGAGGIYATGSARDWGITCVHCHIKGVNPFGVIDASITPNPAWQLVNNQPAYKPGQTYVIAVALLKEHNLGRNGNLNDNLNGFALTVEDASGKTSGVFTSDTQPPVTSTNCPPTAPTAMQLVSLPGTTYVYGDCHGVLSIPRPKATTWTFSWTAPAKGAGTLTIFYGVNDGDANGDSSLEDDNKIGTIKLSEGP